MSHATALLQLRSYRASDFDALHQIDQACFPPGVSYSREELAEFIGHRNSSTWVAEVEGEIAGFLVAGREPQRVGHIITIDVVACWRRRGVGSALMDAAYGYETYVDERTIDSLIKRLRRKLRAVDDHCDVIETLYGVGYRLREACPAHA